MTALALLKRGLGHDGLAILMPERGASAALLATPHYRPVVRATERMWGANANGRVVLIWR